MEENNNPVRIIEKEKDITEEFKARYDVQLISNSKLEKRVIDLIICKIRELEVLLNNEKARYDEFRLENQKDLDLERSTKSKYEEMVLKFKEELMRKEIEINKITTDFDIRVSEEVQVKTDALNENKLLSEKLDRLKGTYEEKYRVLEGKFDNKI